MEILKFSAHNVGNIESVEVINLPKPLAEFFSVENADGKTTLATALKGASLGAGAVPDDFIREGATAADVELHFTDVQINLGLGGKAGHDLKVRVLDPETGKFRSMPSGQQRFLNGYIGTMMDLSGFANLKAEKQEEILRDLAGAEWLAKRTQLAAAEKAAYNARREAKSALESFGVLKPVAPAEPVNVTALAEELRKADAENRRQSEALAAWERDAERKQAAWELQEQAAQGEWQKQEEAKRAAWDKEQAARATAIDKADTALAAAHADSVRLRRELEAAEHREAVAEAVLAKLPKPERQAPSHGTPPAKSAPPNPGPRPEVVEQDTAPLQQQLAEADERNKAATLYARHLEREAEQAKLRAVVKEKEAAVESTRAALATHDAAATLPEGLAFSSDGLTFKGRGLDRMSRGEMIKVIFRAVKQRGQKMMLIDNAEALGPANVKLIRSEAEENDIAVIMFTRGQPHTEGAYELRDGRLVEVQA
ncbi:MAG: hypothetical protein V1755_08700 [Chloroflexota bacterium]